MHFIHSFLLKSNPSVPGHYEKKNVDRVFVDSSQEDDDETDGRRLFQLLNESFFPELSGTANRIWFSYFSLVVSERQTQQGDKATRLQGGTQVMRATFDYLLSCT